MLNRKLPLLFLLLSLILVGCKHKVSETQVVTSDNLVMPYSIHFENNDTALVSTAIGVSRFYLDNSELPELIYPLDEGSPSGIISVNNDIFLLDNPNGSLLALNKDMEFDRIVATELNDPVTMTSDGESIFVTDFDLGGDNSRILKINSNGDIETYLDSDVVTGASGITYIEKKKSLYYTDFNNGRLIKVKENKKQKVIATDLGSPVDVVSYRQGFLVADFGGFEGGAGRLLYVHEETGFVVELLTNLESIVGLKMFNDDLYYTDMLAGKIIRVIFK